MKRIAIGIAALAVSIPMLALAAVWLTVFWSACPTSGVSAGVDQHSNFVTIPAVSGDETKLIIFVPGALNSIDIFSAAHDLKSRGYTLALYRFPGMDGRPLDDLVRISNLADTVLAYAKQSRATHVYVVGFSIGGQAALEAAARGGDRIRKVAVLGGAVGFPDTPSVGWRAMSWVVDRAWQKGTFDLGAVWKEFYKVLLYGAPGVTNPELSARSEAIVAARRNKIVTPTGALVCSHMRDISIRSAVEPRSVGALPVLFVHGELDIVSPIGRVTDYASKFQNSKLNVLRQQGHQIFITEPKLFDMVGAFLEAP